MRLRCYFLGEEWWDLENVWWGVRCVVVVWDVWWLVSGEMCGEWWDVWCGWDVWWWDLGATIIAYLRHAIVFCIATPHSQYLRHWLCGASHNRASPRHCSLRSLGIAALADRLPPTARRDWWGWIGLIGLMGQMGLMEWDGIAPLAGGGVVRMPGCDFFGELTGWELNICEGVGGLLGKTQGNHEKVTIADECLQIVINIRNVNFMAKWL